MPTGVIIIGRKNTTRKNVRPGRFWAQSSARPRPIAYCAETPMPT